MTTNNPTYIELLAPAKNADIGRIAIDAGADAVYIGGPAFGARKAAGNSLEDIEALCRYAHIFGVRVFVTLNTLLRPDEYDEAVHLAYAYRRIGVDAILIQDLYLAQILLQSGHFDHLLHASTQCDIRNLERVQELEAMGFQQVVLARELSINDIRHIHEHTHVALEAFVHGALCVSYSGACYLSEATCGRSANRGECAQMCRLTYDVLDGDMHEMLHQQHVLSLLDLDRSAHLRQLLDAGVTTLKIEGRLKDADYVRNVVAYYRQHLDALFAASNGRYAQSSHGKTHIRFTPDPAKTFHRGATEYFSFFSDGDSPDRRPRPMVNMLTPKSTGEYLGTAPIKDSWNLHNGDGLVAGNQGFYWPSRVNIPTGTPVYRTYNADFQRQLSAKDATRRVLPIRLTLAETADGFSLTIEPIQPARPTTPVSLSFTADKIPATNAERAEAVVRQQLTKLGDTPFEAVETAIRWSQPCFLPAATLNAWRRTATDTLLQSLTLHHEPLTPNHEPLTLNHEPLTLNHAPLMTCRYCLLYEMNRCKRLHPGQDAIPTYLRRGNLLLRIRTDCNRCLMTLHPTQS